MDRDIHQASALVINAHASPRGVMTAQLRELGVGQVRQCSKVADARVVLEHFAADIVLCDDDVAEGQMSGQELLDELRREQLLPYTTVFILVTSEATYAKVVEAAEAALDAVLIKPYTASSLAQRLKESRRRKRLLAPIFEAMQAQQLGAAIELAVERFNKAEPYAMFCARVALELMLRQHLVDDARKLCEAVLAKHPMPWARLGVARTLYAAGDLGAARRATEPLASQGPDGADALDLLARIQVDQGELGAALQSCHRAHLATPGCLLRLQQSAMLAFYLAEQE